jgi:hypothetical protein
MQFEQVNLAALEIAIKTAMGPEAPEVVRKLYVNIEHAMRIAYDRGYADCLNDTDKVYDQGFSDGAEDDLSYNEGWDAGFEEGETSGYMCGVSDARERPAECDLKVAAIIAATKAKRLDEELVTLQSADDMLN